MCGRYTITASMDELADWFGLENRINFPPRYNAAPSQELPIIVKNRIGLASWGFQTPWSRDDPQAPKPINARSETAGQSPMFKESFEKRRCIVPANGFFEWQKSEESKQPYYLYPAHEEIFAFAGLWLKVGEEVTFTILTKPAADEIRSIHSRMPVALRQEAVEDWLACRGGVPEEVPHIAFYPVSTAVNNPRNDRQEILQPLEEE